MVLVRRNGKLFEDVGGVLTPSTGSQPGFQPKRETGGLQSGTFGIQPNVTRGANVGGFQSREQALAPLRRSAQAGGRPARSPFDLQPLEGTVTGQEKARSQRTSQQARQARQTDPFRPENIAQQRATQRTGQAKKDLLEKQKTTRQTQIQSLGLVEQFGNVFKSDNPSDIQQLLFDVRTDDVSGVTSGFSKNPTVAGFQREIMDLEKDFSARQRAKGINLEDSIERENKLIDIRDRFAEFLDIADPESAKERQDAESLAAQQEQQAEEGVEEETQTIGLSQAQRKEIEAPQFEDTETGQQISQLGTGLSETNLTEFQNVIASTQAFGQPLSSIADLFTRLESNQRERDAKALEQRELQLQNQRSLAESQARTQEAEASARATSREKQLRDQSNERVRNVKSQLASSGRLTTDIFGKLDADAIALIDRIESEAKSELTDQIIQSQSALQSELRQIEFNQNKTNFEIENEFFDFSEGQRVAEQTRENAFNQMVLQDFFSQQEQQRKFGFDLAKEQLKGDFFTPDADSVFEVDEDDRLSAQKVITDIFGKTFAKSKSGVARVADAVLKRSKINPATGEQWTFDDIGDDIRASSFSEEAKAFRGIINSVALKVSPSSKDLFINEADRLLDEEGDVDKFTDWILLGARGSSKDEKSINQVQATLNFFNKIEKDMQEYINKGGKLGLLAGGKEAALNRILRKTGNDELAEFGAEIAGELFNFISGISGKQFTDAEFARYKGVFPSGTKDWNLNIASINGLRSSFQRSQDNFYRQTLGTQNFRQLFPDNSIESFVNRFEGIDAGSVDVSRLSIEDAQAELAELQKKKTVDNLPSQEEPVVSRTPPQFQGFFLNSAQGNNVPQKLLSAIGQQESGFQPTIKSSAGAQGIMQLIPATAKRFGVQDINDPQQNIEGGAKYMNFLLDRYDNNLQLALAGYNSGEGNVDKAIKRANSTNWEDVKNNLITSRENQRQTIDYVSSILAILNQV